MREQDNAPTAPGGWQGDGHFPFFGAHQSGILTPQQDRLHFASSDITTDSRGRVIALLRRWTQAAATLMAGPEVGSGAAGGPDLAPPDDTGEALDLGASGLTITTGFGRTSSTTRVQKTPRSLMGFKDGTANLRAEDDGLVTRWLWADGRDGHEWTDGGTDMVAHKIRILVETWDRTSLTEQESSVGRTKGSGAPLSGGNEFTDPNTSGRATPQGTCSFRRTATPPSRIPVAGTASRCCAAASTARTAPTPASRPAVAMTVFDGTTSVITAFPPRPASPPEQRCLEPAHWRDTLVACLHTLSRPKPPPFSPTAPTSLLTISLSSSAPAGAVPPS